MTNNQLYFLLQIQLTPHRAGHLTFLYFFLVQNGLARPLFWVWNVFSLWEQIQFLAVCETFPASLKIQRNFFIGAYVTIVYPPLLCLSFGTEFVCFHITLIPSMEQNPCVPQPCVLSFFLRAYSEYVFNDCLKNRSMS